MTVGDRIKKLREEKKMTQEELAAYIKSTKQTIYKYENNVITNIPSNKIESIAKALETSPAYIMGWDESSLNERIEQTTKELSVVEKVNEKKRSDLEVVLSELKSAEISEERKTELLNIMNSLLKENAILRQRSAILNEELSKLKSDLLEKFNSLNESGQKKAIESVELLTKISEYTEQPKITPLPRKEEIPEHLKLNAARPRKEATGEYLQHDEEIMDDPNF